MGLVTKTFTFSPGSTIVSSEHNTNFDTLYNVINANISNANIETNASIVASKLDLSTISQAVSISGNLTLSGAANDFSAATFSDLGTVTTADINGGTIDGTTIGASSATTGKFTTSTENSAHLTETTAPSTAAGEMALYTKDTNGQPELFVREESDGNEVQITNNGAINAALDYYNNFGRQTDVAYAFGSGRSGTDFSISRNAIALTSLANADLVTGKVTDFCYDFDGAADKAIITNNGELTGISKATIEVWVYPDSVTGTRTIAVNTTTGLELRFNGTLWATNFRTSSGNENMTGTHGLTISQWNHCIFVFDNTTTGKIYVDGLLDDTGNDTGNGTLTDNDLAIGSSFAGGDYWDGKIDGLRIIVGQAFTAEQALARYNLWL